MLIPRGLYGSGERVVFPHISGMPGRNTARLGDLVHRRVEFLPGAADQRNRGAVLRKTAGDGEIDSAAAAGDDGILPRQSNNSRSIREAPNLPMVPNR